MPSAVLYTSKGHIASITLNRPGAKNIADRALADELAEVCARIGADDDVYAVTLTGAGGVFCGGGEPGLPAHPAAAIAAIDRPVIAAIDGEALGEGLELALACDIRLASDRASFGLPQVAQGMLPAGGGTQRLPRIVGRGKALEMLLTGDTFTAAEALEMGLVSRVVPAGDLEAAAMALAGKIAAMGPVALRYVKEAVNGGMDMTLAQGLRLEADLYFLLHTTADRTEGIRAFQEKRPPDFKGE